MFTDVSTAGFEDVRVAPGGNYCVHNWWGSCAGTSEQGLAVHCGKHYDYNILLTTKHCIIHNKHF